MKLVHLLLFLSLSGCVHQQQMFDSTGAEKSLTSWLQHELSPYLSLALSRESRFRDQSIMLVKLQGVEIQTEIDQLTRHIRKQIEDGLLDTPGIKLPWQPLLHAQPHHRRLSSIHCRQSQTADYYIGLEVTPALGGRHRVSVRALDISERQWVSGFGQTWQGKLSAEEIRALSASSPDESLRGLRPLPFTSNQLDLAADYLANNVSCLLQQQDEDELLLQVAQASGQSAAIQKLSRLVTNNLSRYHEVRITDRADKANFVLRLEGLAVQQDLQQLWISITGKSNGERLSGMDTSTYIQQLPSSVIPRPAPAYSRVVLPELQNLQLRTAHNSTECTGNQCIQLRMNVHNTTELFIIRHQAPARLTRQYPASCDSAPQAERQLPADFRLDIQAPPGEATYYAIAVSPLSRTDIAKHLRRLSSTCAVTDSTTAVEDMQYWLSDLEKLMQQHARQISWAAVRKPGR